METKVDAIVVEVPPSPPKKKVQSRYVHWNEFKGHTGRWVTMRYNYNAEDRLLTYAAVVYRKEPDRGCTFSKKKQRKHVDLRFTMKPVVLEDFIWPQQDLKRTLRRLLFTHGVLTHNKPRRTILRNERKEFTLRDLLKEVFLDE